MAQSDADPVVDYNSRATELILGARSRRYVFSNGGPNTILGRQGLDLFFASPDFDATDATTDEIFVPI